MTHYSSTSCKRSIRSSVTEKCLTGNVCDYAVTYHKSIPSATSTGVALIGATSGIKATIKSWALAAANNAGPQPMRD